MNEDVMTETVVIPPDYLHLAEAYLRLLRTPIDSEARAKLQGTLSSMRDVLAEGCGAEPEFVQNYCEDAARRHNYVLSTNDIAVTLETQANTTF